MINKSTLPPISSVDQTYADWVSKNKSIMLIFGEGRSEEVILPLARCLRRVFYEKQITVAVFEEKFWAYCQTQATDPNHAWFVYGKILTILSDPIITPAFFHMILSDILGLSRDEIYLALHVSMVSATGYVSGLVNEQGLPDPTGNNLALTMVRADGSIETFRIPQAAAHLIAADFTQFLAATDHDHWEADRIPNLRFRAIIQQLRGYLDVYAKTLKPTS